MFSRLAIQRTAWAVLTAVLFAVLWPASLNAAGQSAAMAALSGAHSICTVNGAHVADAVPDAPAPQPAVGAHKPCVFCISSVPLFADANAPRMAAPVAVYSLLAGAGHPESLPPDVAATQPLSPRAPPRRV